MEQDRTTNPEKTTHANQHNPTPFHKIEYKTEGKILGKHRHKGKPTTLNKT